MKSLWAFVFVALLAATVHAQAPAKPDRPVLRIAYFIPTDRQPEADRVERLDRVMTEVQRFFREGMEAAVKTPLTFELDRGESGKLRIHDVRGKEPMKAYGRDAAGKVRDEVKAALAKENIDLDRETVVIFQVLLEWQGPKAVEIGPYVGGGDAHSGTAWVYDDAKLDPKLLASKDPGGFYVRPCSLGEFNTHYIGGVAHELGHALGLPHERERLDETATRGHSLMGAGNHTYGQDLRGEGRGTFLTTPAALPLAVHPLFTGKRQPRADLSCQIAELEATPEKGRFTLRGRVQGGPPVVSLIAYADFGGIPGDYDAIAFTSSVAADGRFETTVADLGAGLYELRLRVMGQTGDTRYFPFVLAVDATGMPQVDSLEMPWLLRAYQAYHARDRKQLTAIVDEAKKTRPKATVLLRKLAHYAHLAASPPPVDLAKVPAEMKSISLSEVAFEAESTGWGPAFRNQVSGDGDGSGLIEISGQFFESGLYAHAPARHAVRINKQWKTLTTSYGLQDRHHGSVVFVIKADGKELLRSEKITDHKLRTKSVDISQATVLELTVENAADGNNSDWGVWVEPKLER